MCTHQSDLELQTKTKELCQQATNVVKAFMAMKDKTNDPDSSVFNYLKAYMMPAVFGQANAAMATLENSVSGIPSTWEKLIETRNIVSIKSQLFARSTHVKVCGQQDEINLLMGAFLGGVKVWCGAQLVTPAQLLGSMQWQMSSRVWQ